MALNLDSKKAVVEEVAQFAAKAHSAVAAEYRGLTVTELTELRKTARETGVYLRAFSMEDPGSAGRLISNFAKTHDKLITKIVAIGGQAFDGSELARLASLPTRNQGISLLMSVMKAPVEKFVRTLAAVKDQMQEAA